MKDSGKWINSEQLKINSFFSWGKLPNCYGSYCGESRVSIVNDCKFPKLEGRWVNFEHCVAFRFVSDFSWPKDYGSFSRLRHFYKLSVYKECNKPND